MSLVLSHVVPANIEILRQVVECQLKVLNDKERDIFLKVCVISLVFTCKLHEGCEVVGRAMLIGT